MKKTILAIMLALAMVLIPVGSAFAQGPEEKVVTITADPNYAISIANSTAAWLLTTAGAGAVDDDNTVYWWNGSEPTAFLGGGTLNPATECASVIENDGTVEVDISITGTDFIGGDAWTLVTGGDLPPELNEVQLTAWIEGDLLAAGVDLINAFENVLFVTNLDDDAPNDTTAWEMRLVSPLNFTDVVQKQATVTLLATQYLPP
jgi:hypothetical protein